MTRFHGIIISYAFWCNKTPIDWIFGWQQLNCYPGHQLLPLVSPLPTVGVAGKNKLAVALIRVNKCIIISKKGKLALCNSAPHFTASWNSVWWQNYRYNNVQKTIFHMGHYSMVHRCSSPNNWIMKYNLRLICINSLLILWFVDRNWYFHIVTVNFHFCLF